MRQARRGSRSPESSSYCRTQAVRMNATWWLPYSTIRGGGGGGGIVAPTHSPPSANTLKTILILHLHYFDVFTTTVNLPSQYLSQ